MLIKRKNTSALFSDDRLEQLREGQLPIQMLSADGGLESRTIQLAAAGPDDAHTTQELVSTYLAGYSQADKVADELSPFWMVDNLTGIYRTMDPDNVFRRVNVTAGFQDPVPEVGVKSSTAEFRCTLRFCGAFVDEVSEANATAYSPLMESGKRAAEAIMLDRECRVFDLATTLGNWDSNFRTTLGATAHWKTGTASAPIDDLRAAVQNSRGTGYHRIWMNWDGINALFDHPQVKDYLRLRLGDGGISGLASQMSGGLRSGQRFRFDLPMIGEVCVAPARVKNESTGALDYILKNDVIVEWGERNAPTNGSTMHTFKTAKFKGLAGVGLETRRFKVPTRGPSGGDMIVVAVACVELVTGNTIGKLIKAAY